MYPKRMRTTAPVTHARRIRICASAVLDSLAKRPIRLSRKPARSLTSASRLWSKPACPAGLRNRIESPAISAQSLAAENQPENESNSQRGEDRLGWIFPDVLLAVFLE